MVNQKQKARMTDYVVACLEGSGPKIQPVRNQNVQGLEASCILVGNEGVVLLVDQVFPRDSFRRLWTSACSQFGNNVGIVFYKDGKIFFRSAAPSKFFKKGKGLSLKGYSDEDIQRMITTRPEEALAIERGRRLQYFQPESERLSEGLVSFKFSPVTFDYSHIDSSVQFKPENRESAKLYIWREKSEHTGELELKDGYLINSARAIDPTTLNLIEKAIHDRIHRLPTIASGERETAEESLCLAMENLPDNHPLVREYQQTVKSFGERK